MKVVSVNIGKSVEINYHGKVVKTGMYKYPVESAITLGIEDVVGDDVIDRRYHGGKDKACYWYSEKHYEFWKERFPDLDWSYGMFGENLTISDIDEREVRIGDIYKVGSAVVQVTQPRQPCYKLNYRFNCESMVKEFIKEGFSGIYIRVLKPGEVQKGDGLELIERNNKSFSVMDIYRMLYNKEEYQEEIRKAILDKALAESFRKDLQK